MPQLVIEGTWEEIKQHEAQLAGRQLRVIVKAEKPAVRRSGESDKRSFEPAQPKVLRAHGMLKGLLSVDDFIHEKHEDTLREDRQRL